MQGFSSEGPSNFRNDARIHSFTSLSSHDYPALPNSGDTLTVGCRSDLIRAVGWGDGPAVFHFEKCNQTRIDLLDGHRETGKSMRRRLIVRCGCPRSRYEWQCKMDAPLPNDPDSKFAAGSISEVFEARHVGKARKRYKTLHSLFFKGSHEQLVGADYLSEECRSLLPFALFCYVAVVAPTKGEDGQQVCLIIEIALQPGPSGKISGGKVGEWCRPEFRVLPQEGRDLHGVHVTDRAEASSPGITVAVGRQQIPPEFHLLFKRWRESVGEVYTPGEFGGIVKGSRIFI